MLGFLGSGRQLASVMVFVVVLLATGVVEVALIDQKQEIGKKGESLEARGDMSGRPSENIERRAGEQPSNQNQLSQKREIRRKQAETAKHNRRKSESAQNTAFIAHPTNLLYRLVPASPQSPTSTTEMRENSPKTAPEAEDMPGEPRNTVPERERTEMVMPALLPGQSGAPHFDGKDITKFLKTWERFATRYKLTPEEKVYELMEYCDSETAAYMMTLVEKTEASEGIESEAERQGKHWKDLKEEARERYMSMDTEQAKRSVAYLKALVHDSTFRENADMVERYIYNFRDISKVLVEDCRLNGYDQLRMFLSGLPGEVARPIYTKLGLKMKKPKLFAEEAVFDKAVETALTLNRETEDFRLMQEETGTEVEAKREYRPGETVKKILQKPGASPPMKPEQRPPPQATQGPPANIAFHRDDTMEQIVKGMEEMRLNQMRLSEKVGYLYSQRMTGFEETDYPVGPPRRTITQADSVKAHPRACRWCGNFEHIKVRCPDYQNCLAQEIVHYPNQNDTRTRLGPKGSDGPIVPLPEYSGLWQQTSVDRERRKPESQMQRNRIKEVLDHPTPPPPAADSGSGKVRVLTLEEIPREQVSPMVGALIVGSSGLDLRPGEIRSFVAPESEEGEVEG